MRLSNRLHFAFVALLALAACASYRPPFTQPSTIASPVGADEATVVFLWPETSCDPAGYFTLATAGGRFVGNVSRGAQLRAALPAGETTVLGWNELVESANGTMSAATVAVLHADLRAGRTYFVRMAFGEWDANGPPLPGLRPGTYVARGDVYRGRRCIRLREGATSAMLTLSPSSESWSELPQWTAQLDAVAPDRAAGQAWLDANRAALGSHAAVASNRFAQLRPEAQRLATILPDDGVGQ